MKRRNTIIAFITNYIEIPYNWHIEHINFFEDLHKGTTVSIVFSILDKDSRNKNFVACEFSQNSILEIIVNYKIYYEKQNGNFYIHLKTVLFDLRGNSCAHKIYFAKDRGLYEFL